MGYVNNRCFISKILLVCCVHSLDFRYRELARKYHTDRLCMKYSIPISFVLIDIDECLNRSHACDVNANCTNTDGSYNCTCKEGYTGDGQSCQGILDQTVHHTELLLTTSRACPKFTNMEGYNVIYKFRHGRWSVINYRTTFTLLLFSWSNPFLRMRYIQWLTVCIDLCIVYFVDQYWSETREAIVFTGYKLYLDK